MISIENANLELALSELFSRLLQINLRLGEAIYLTPKSAFARLEILENAAGTALAPQKTIISLQQRGADDKPLSDRGVNEKRAAALHLVNGIIGRARTVVGKRHTIIHDLWGIDSDTFQVGREAIPRLESGTEQVVPIEQLTTLIREIRELITEARALSAELKRNHPLMVDMQLSAPDKTP